MCCVALSCLALSGVRDNSSQNALPCLLALSCLVCGLPFLPCIALDCHTQKLTRRKEGNSHKTRQGTILPMDVFLASRLRRPFLQPRVSAKDNTIQYNSRRDEMTRHKTKESQDKTITRQDEARQDKIRQQKTRQGNRRQDNHKIRQSQDKTITRQDDHKTKTKTTTRHIGHKTKQDQEIEARLCEVEG